MEQDGGSTYKNEGVAPPRRIHSGSGNTQEIVIQRRPHFSQELHGGTVLQQQAPDLQGATEIKWLQLG